MTSPAGWQKTTDERIPLYTYESGHKELADLDLGDGHFVRYTYNQAEEICGAIVLHTSDLLPTGYCSGSIMFDVPEADAYRKPEAGTIFWQVQSREPLTISPSLLCHCGDHGFIENGKWRRV